MTYQRAAILGVEFDQLDEERVVAHVFRGLDEGTGGWMVTPNLHILRQVATDPEIAHLIRSAPLVIMDGAPVEWAGRIARRTTVGRVPGSTVFWSLCEAAAQSGRPVLLMGGRVGAAELAVARLRELYPGIIATSHFPPFGFESDPEAIRIIEETVENTGAALVFVGLGCPKQERLMASLSARFPGVWFFGVGAAIDFASGQVDRAPLWMQKAGLEWSHRLVTEPRRLGRRYLLEDLPFAVRLMRWALEERVQGAPATTQPQPAVLAARVAAHHGVALALSQALDEASVGSTPAAKGHFREVLESDAATPGQRAQALDGLVELLWRDGKYSECVDLLRTRLALPYDRPNQRWLSQSHLVYALAECGQGDLALATAEQSISQAEAAGVASTSEVVMLRATMAGLLRGQGDLISAELQISLALAAGARLPDPVAVAPVLWNAALISGDDGRPEEALSLARSARALFRGAGDDLSAARLEVVELKIMLDHGIHVPLEPDYWAMVLEVLQERGSASHVGLAHIQLARLHMAVGDPHEAYRQIQISLALIGDNNPIDTAEATAVRRKILKVLGGVHDGERLGSSEVVPLARQSPRDAEPVSVLKAAEVP